MEIQITREIAEKVLATVDAGLVAGVGEQRPGEMCVEAAVCYAMGLPHGDEPSCVAPALRAFKIRLNDANWPSKEKRAFGLRRLALIQLGSKDSLDEKDFAARLSVLTIKKIVPFALRAAALKKGNKKHKLALEAAANLCEREGTHESAIFAKNIAYAAAYAAAADADAAAAYTAAYAAAAAAADADAYAAADADAAADAAVRFTMLSEFAENVVQLLIEMKVPGVQWLDLAPLPA